MAGELEAHSCSKVLLPSEAPLYDNVIYFILELLCFLSIGKISIVVSLLLETRNWP